MNRLVKISHTNVLHSVWYFEEQGRNSSQCVLFYVGEGTAECKHVIIHFLNNMNYNLQGDSKNMWDQNNKTSYASLDWGFYFCIPFFSQFNSSEKRCLLSTISIFIFFVYNGRRLEGLCISCDIKGLTLL